MKHIAVAVLILPFAVLPVRAQSDPKAIEFFETKIRPVLVEHCYKCHGPEKQKAGIRVDRRDKLVEASDEGALVIPGNPDKSRLIHAVRYSGEAKMPPKGKLPDAVLADLATWVKAGAVWPADKTASAEPKDAWRKHWAFQPVGDPQLPKVKGPVAASVDAFILAKLEEKHLTQNPAADRRTQIRRLKFDLLGLPATFEEVEAFVRDSDPKAYEKLVDRYLASPQYGERWARHWLDVARYADNKGYVFTEERKYPYAYTYRDYVIQAFNEDVPFDRFVREQIAADRLVAKKQAEPASQAAMGFLTLGRRFLNNTHDIIDDRIDVVTRGLQGLTVACARCHDHKFDPIPAKDYYSLYGIFASSKEPTELPMIGEPKASKEYDEFKSKADQLDGAVAAFRKEHEKEIAGGNRRDLRDKLAELKMKADSYKASSPAAPPRAMALADEPTPMEPVVFLRGNPGSRGPKVPRQYLEVVSTKPRVPFKDGSGRLELADAIASKDNPLTARVFVNRVWLQYFGKGLVTSPSDFGVRTEPPSHPELLDHLARRFMDDGWSVKKLHRMIVLSNTYRQSSARNKAAEAADPENRLLARMPRRRLDFEATRDSILAVAGTLDLTIGGRPVDIVATKSSPRRTIYGFIDRQNLPGLFRTFDFASPDISSPQRYETTVPQQALFLLNSPFLLDQSRALLHRPEIDDQTEPAEKIRVLYQVVLGRDASEDEIRLGETFVKTAVDEANRSQLSAWERFGQALMLTNEFVYVD
jgi:mono/diheme cytochrome c family protein